MSPVLRYFDGRGRIEIIRLVLAVAGIQWTDKNVYEKEEYLSLQQDGKLLFQQLPLIEYEGKNMVQSGAIVRYFAKKAHLMGDNPEEELRIDTIFEGTRDFYSPFLAYGFAGYKETLDKIKENVFPRYLPAFNKILISNGSNGFLSGDKITLADIGLFEVILMIEELMDADVLDDYPEIKKFSANIKENEKIVNYLNGPQRFKVNDDEYIAVVKRVLF